MIQIWKYEKWKLIKMFVKIVFFINSCLDVSMIKLWFGWWPWWCLRTETRPWLSFCHSKSSELLIFTTGNARPLQIFSLSSSSLFLLLTDSVPIHCSGTTPSCSPICWTCFDWNSLLPDLEWTQPFWQWAHLSVWCWEWKDM